MKRKVLICGGGVAGLTLAYWLHRWGFVPTVVERASSLREGGYVIDFFGPGYDVAERMGLGLTLARHDLHIPRLDFVDARGRRRAGIDIRLWRELMRDRLRNLPRGALVRALFDAVEDDVELIFGDSVKAMTQHAHGVDVELDRSGARAFDLVVGADGAHSRVRRLAFDANDEDERYLGYAAASFTFTSTDAVDSTSFATFTRPGRQIGIYPLTPDRHAALFVFASERPVLVERTGRDAQLEALRRAFRGLGWRADELLERAGGGDAGDFYFDSVSQVCMPSWSRERVVLVGDACGAPSLLSGQGASLAMAGAYVLAGELNAAAGGHRSAFARYQQIMKPYVDERQAQTARFASSFLPSTALGVVARDAVARLMSFRRVSAWFLSRFTAGTLALDRYGVD